jgi:hypothetical protein
VFPILFSALAYAMLDRWDDVFYRFNNVFLCGYTGYKFYNSIMAYYRIRYIGPSLPLKDWLKRWVNYKQKFGKTRSLLSMLFIPVFIASLFLSVYLYISEDSMQEVLDHPAFAFGFLSALITARMFAILIRRKKQMKQLQYLQDLYNEL